MKRRGVPVAAEGVREAVRALRDNRFRTVLSILGVTAGVAAVLVVGSVSRGGRARILEELDTFGLRAIWVARSEGVHDPRRAVRGGTGIVNDDLDAIRAASPAVARLTPMVLNFGRWVVSVDPALNVRSGDRWANAVVEGVDVEYFDIVNDRVVHGRNFRDEEVRRGRSVAVIGPDAAEELFAGAASAVGRSFQIGDERVLVIGVLGHKSRDLLASLGTAGGFSANNRVLIPYTLYQRMLGVREVSFLQAEAVTPEASDAAIAQMIGVLERRHDYRYRYEAQTMQSHADSASRILDGVGWIGVVAASVSLFVGGIGILNVMSTAVVERTREIGLRKAVGARDRDILLQFLMEAVFVSGVGGVLGLAVGAAASAALGHFTGFSSLPSGPTVAAALGVSIAVGLLSGYWPARRAARMRPVVALRDE